MVSPHGPRRRLLPAAFLLAAAAPLSPALAAFTTESFVTFQTGDVPVILTAPHGGTQSIPDVAERTAPGANLSGDTRTRELTIALAAELEPLLGGKPYVVLADFERRLIDANREDSSVRGAADSLAANLAYNDVDARPVYQKYHGKIREFIDQIHDDFAFEGVLLDIHGQGRFPSTVYRGTDDGESACGLVTRHGEAALTGPLSIVGVLAAQGYDVFPPVGAPLGDPSESTGHLNGGHTVDFYGTCSDGISPDDIEAIQVETGGHLRNNPAQRTPFARALARAVAVFYAEFVDTGHELPPLPAIVRATDLPGLTSTATGGLGRTLAIGDFNHDGHADVAAGRPGGNGLVRVFYGHDVGLTAVFSEDLTQATFGATAQSGDEFGAALAAGDFNDDTFDDLAIGIPGDDPGATDAGSVVVVYGGARGFLDRNDGAAALITPFERLTQAEVSATNEKTDRFGSTLAAGDFNHNGVADLAVGVPDEDDDAENDGMVVVLFGSRTFGLLRTVSGVERAVSFERVVQSHAGATNESGDRFGAALAVGDFNANGFADLAVGMPEENDQANNDGIVVVLYGSSEGLLRVVNGVTRAVSAERLAQNHAGATPEATDRFGFALAAGDFNGNGVVDLAVGVPYEDDEAENDGMVVVFYGSTTQGLLRTVNGAAQAVSVERLVQRHAGATNERGDRFGAALAAGNFNGDASVDLAVGSPDEFDQANRDGLVIAFDGSTTSGLLRVVNGVTSAVGFRRLGQVTFSMASEAIDRFGLALAAGDTDGDGCADLLIAAPGEDIASLNDGGALYVRRGGAGGL